LRFERHGLAQLAISTGVERGLERVRIKQLGSLREGTLEALALELRHRKRGSGA